jgi:membrane-bound lytic murein transglycosylase A
MAAPQPTFQPVTYAALPGWRDDNHLAAFDALVGAADAVLAADATPLALAAVYRAALGQRPLVSSADSAREFFEARFVPHRVVHSGSDGLLTGYYEPILDGAMSAGGRFTVPLYRRPADLQNVVSEADRGARSEGLTHVRRLSDGRTEPYATREQIERGALAGAGLEVMYLADPVDVFMLHVQGSGAIRLPDGRLVRVTYDGKNGHPYTSVGRVMIDQGLFRAEDLTLETMTTWLKGHPEQARTLLWHNKSFVFFRLLEGEAPVGVLGSPLAVGRSLAVDTAFHALGSPIYVSSPTMTHVKPGGFHRLMLAHDVGSAIKGPERGDVFFGTGREALALAGVTKHRGSFHVLLPGAQP